MEEKHVTIQDASQFVRSIIELGGVYKVDGTDFIVDTVDGAAATIDVKGQPKPIMIWSEKAKLGDHVLLNIFGETVNTTDERNWFYTFVSMVPGHIVRNMMISIINAALAKEQDKAYEAMDVISPFVKDIDDKTKNELNLIAAKDIATIVYHKPSKTAQLQTKLFEDDFKAVFGKKIRGKTWKLFDAMFKTLMNIENEQQMSDTFKSSAVILGMKQTDAMVLVLVKFIENVDAYVRILLNQESNLGTLISGVQNLELFFGIMRVFTSGGGSQKVESKAPAASPFGKSAPATPQSTPKGRVVPVGNAMPIVLPDVVGKQKSIPISQPKMPALPDVLHPGRTVTVQPGSSFGFRPYGSQGSIFGKPVAIDNTQQLRSQGPKVRQILANGKLV